MRLITAILLAAGASRRFGSPKLLCPVDGTPMIVRSAQNLAAADRIIAVVPHVAPALKRLLTQSGLNIEPCPVDSDGLGTSIACGVRAGRDAHGWLIALADMPFVLPATVAAVAQALAAGAPIVAPVYRGRRGHPVGFGREYYDRLAALRGDLGARDILDSEDAHLMLLAVDDPGIHRDIDTLGDIPP